MGHRAAHGRQGRHQLAEPINPWLALLVFAAGCVRCGCWNPTTRYCDCAVAVEAPRDVRELEWPDEPLGDAHALHGRERRGVGRRVEPVAVRYRLIPW